MRTLEDRIQYTLDKIRPYLVREGGDITIDRYDYKTGILYVKMVGACQGCALATSDISDSIEALVMQEVPEVTGVRLAGKEADYAFRSFQQQLRHPHTIKEQQEEEKKTK
ncbi:MAG: NifU family protein [Eubacteriales bacterium]|nr:NifU family protein [Eubacteriales bacterium]